MFAVRRRWHNHMNLCCDSPSQASMLKLLSALNLMRNDMGIAITYAGYCYKMDVLIPWGDIKVTYVSKYVFYSQNIYSDKFGAGSCIYIMLVGYKI
jgi:hypothetical protein